MPDPDESTFPGVLENTHSLNPTLSTFPKDATWEDFVTFKQSKLTSVALTKLKNMRSNLLQQSDWIFTTDNAQNLANLNEWTTYRQSLRDFFSNPSFKLILNEDTGEPDLTAMKFPPPQPSVIRK